MGVLDLPVKLAVCFLVIGLMTPLVVDAMDVAEEEISLNALRQGAEDLEADIVKAFRSGAGTTVTHHVSLPPGQSIAAGGEGPDSYTLRLCLDGEVVEAHYLDNPAVPVLNGETFISGQTSVKITCGIVDGVYGVVME